jgi:hypothetical protein
VCDPGPVTAEPGAVVRQGALAPVMDLESAILEVVSRAVPGVGRTRAVEILRGGRSKAILKHSYDGLPGYGGYRDVRADDVLAAIDALIAAGRLRLAGGRAARLEVAPPARRPVGSPRSVALAAAASPRARVSPALSAPAAASPPATGSPARVSTPPPEAP